MKKILLPLFLLTIIFAGCTSKQNTLPQACDMDAKACADGSAVGRSGSNCEFAACPMKKTKTPSTCSCSEGYRQEGEACNPECYYSTPKCLMPSRQCE